MKEKDLSPALSMVGIVHFHRKKKSGIWHSNKCYQICLKIIMKPNFLQAKKITKALFVLMIESES